MNLAEACVDGFVAAQRELENPKKTHYDSIRNMSIERLALFLSDMCDGSNREYWLAWLRQEVDDADTR